MAAAGISARLLAPFGGRVYKCAAVYCFKPIDKIRRYFVLFTHIPRGERLHRPAGVGRRDGELHEGRAPVDGDQPGESLRRGREAGLPDPREDIKLDDDLEELICTLASSV